MKHISTAHIQKLRQQTGVGILEAKKALTAAQGDMALAMENLRKAGQKLAAAKSARSAAEGVVGTYLHPNGKISAMVGLACETDFVARTDDFKNLAHDLAMHIAAANPQYLQSADVPATVVAKEREIFQAQLKAEGKPAKMWTKIVTGKLEKFYAENCLLNQPFIKDDAKTVTQVIEAMVTKFGENIKVNSFARLSV